MAVSIRHREKLREEKHQKETPQNHLCVCAHCGRLLPKENDYSNESADTDLESELSEDEP